MDFNFRQTELYKKAIKYNCSIKDIVKEKRPDRSLESQFKRAGNSVVLNIAEGFGRFHKADKCRFYVTARASVHECVACADLIYDMSVPEDFINLSTELGKMLSGLINKIKG